MAEAKINLLVVPDLFPRYPGEIRGVFVLDYLTSVLPYCNVTVLFVDLTGEKVGLNTYTLPGPIKVLHYTVSTGSKTPLSKPLLYRKWFKEGKRLGMQLTDTDLIHTHGTVLAGTLGARIAKQLNIPFIVTEHTGPFSSLTNHWLKKKWTKKILEKATAVLTVSQHLANEIKAEGIQPKQTFVTFNPVDTELFVPAASLQRTYNLLFVGRLDDFKGAYRCLQAFHRLLLDFPDWHFTIIGDGQERELIETYIRKNTLSETVTTTGYLSKAEIASHMQRADFLVFPSVHESFGLVAAEAMSACLPVIVGNKTAPPEFVPKSCGILVPPMDEKAIEQAMRDLIANYESYDRPAIREHVVNRFGFDAFGAALANIYRKVLQP